MRTAAVVAAMLLGVPAQAATEPEPMSKDPRIVKADYREGDPVILRCKIGNACRIIFKGPWRIFQVMPSDQALISNIAPPQGGGRQGGRAPDEGGIDQEPSRPPEAMTDPDTNCDYSRTLTLCKTLGYMLTITPAIGQDEQSLQVVMVHEAGRAKTYLNVDFLFSTVDREPAPALPGGDDEAARIVRIASGQMEAPKPAQHFQTLHLTLNPPEMPRAAPVVAAQPVRRPVARVVPPQPVTAPVRPLSAPYHVTGDASLIGGAR